MSSGYPCGISLMVSVISLFTDVNLVYICIVLSQMVIVNVLSGIKSLALFGHHYNNDIFHFLRSVE